MTRVEGLVLDERTVPEADVGSEPSGAVGSDPPWARWALLGLLVVTAVGYLWNIGRNGWGNTFYAAAVQSGTHSWSAFFFGSFDWGDYITVDKPPVSLWIMALSGRIFGFSAWSMLAPEALLGVGSVALLYATVRRAWGASAGLIAGVLLALTPAAALMFRFNNPDAALTFLLVAAAYTLTRAVKRGGMLWLLATSVLLGTAFLTKSLQAVLVVPGLALAYLVCAPGRLFRRIGQLSVAGATFAVSGLWWPLLVDAIPAGSRPYAGGSTKNSVMQLILGFNGLGRITGREGGPGGGPTGGSHPGGGGMGGGPGGGMGGGFGGTPGLGRMFNTMFGGFIAWWLPAALIGLVAGIWLVFRARRGQRRTDPRLASLIVWGGWTIVTAAVFSFASGIIHTYYTVALAPGVAALAGMTLPALWRRRSEIVARGFLGVATAATAAMAFLLLRRAPDWQPWLAWAVLVVGLTAAVLLIVVRPPRPGSGARGRGGLIRGLSLIAGVGAVVAGVAGPLAWSLVTIGTTHVGSIPTAGPAVASDQGDPHGLMPGSRHSGRDGFPEGGLPGPGDFPGGGMPPGGQEGWQPDAGSGPGPLGGGMPGRQGESPDVGSELTQLIAAGASGYRWVAAASSSMTAGPLQLSVNAPVISLGGFSGGDPAITLERFKSLVAAHQVHYYLGESFSGPGGPGGQSGRNGQGRSGGPGGQGAVSSIAAWVSSSFTATTVGSATVYDLSKPLTSTS